MRPAQLPQPPGPGTQRARFGRIYNPPLRYVRSARVLLMPVPGGPMWASAPTECLRRWCVRRDCRGALYMRPAQLPQPPGPGTQRARFGRIYNPPLRYVRSARVLFMPVPGGPMWASAPTERLRRWCVRRDCRGALYMRPAQLPQPPGLGTQRARFERIYNPPLRYVRSARVLLMPVPSGPMWASAPTERLRFPRKDGPFHIPYPPAGGENAQLPNRSCAFYIPIFYRVTPPGGR